MSEPSTEASRGSDAPDEVAELRAQLERARAGERRARELLEALASLVSLDDTEALFRGIARNAVRHIGFRSVSVYEADHDAGTLREVARAETDSESDVASPEPMPQVRVIEPDVAPVELGPGNALAEFALSNRSRMILPEDGLSGDGGDRYLVKMRTTKADSSLRSGLIGVIDACGGEDMTKQAKDLLRSLASLASAAAEARRVESFRTQLVSSVSHELRTPLAAIRAYNELLFDEDAGPINEEQRLFLERIEKTCLSLDRLVEDLLDLSQLRAGQLEIRKEPVDVATTIEHILDTLRHEASRREISLDAEIAGELPLISSNADRLGQVLLNLVGNAVKYVDYDGTVLVRAGLHERGKPSCSDKVTRSRDGVEDDRLSDRRLLVIEVIDDGPGIAPEDIEHVFDEFYRGRLTVGSAKGSGLGLSIARRLARLLGGSLEVESTPEEGSTFYLAFPIDDPKAETDGRPGGISPSGVET